MNEQEITLMIDAYAELHEAGKRKFEAVEKKKKIEYIKNHFDLRTLKKVGFFADVNIKDYEAVEKRICHFFGLDNIFEYGMIGIGTPALLCGTDGTAQYYSGNIIDNESGK